MERDTTSQLIADNVTRLMQERKVSALALAERSKMGRSSVYDIISGRSQSAKVATVAKIAAALEVPILELFLTPDHLEGIQELLRAYSSLPEEEQRRLARVARAWQQG